MESRYSCDKGGPVPLNVSLVDTVKPSAASLIYSGLEYFRHTIAGAPTSATSNEANAVTVTTSSAPQTHHILRKDKSKLGKRQAPIPLKRAKPRLIRPAPLGFPFPASAATAQISSVPNLPPTSEDGASSRRKLPALGSLENVSPRQSRPALSGAPTLRMR